MDPLGVFFTQPLDVKRLIGTGPYGDQHADAVTVSCRLRWENKMVRDGSGEEVVAAATASMSAATPIIAAGSLVRTPTGRWRKVIAEARHVGGFDMSPDYYSIEIS
ncbi:hypothetical protein [Gordonia caeni]|uniref:Head-to-tail stopper n=1 Tax=Gordonia caeni TaxID=1007097 RepID=A0ABP7PCQ3_9ACTN